MCYFIKLNIDMLGDFSIIVACLDNNCVLILDDNCTHSSYLQIIFHMQQEVLCATRCWQSCSVHIEKKTQKPINNEFFFFFDNNINRQHFHFYVVSYYMT